MSRADWSAEDWEALGHVGQDLLIRFRADLEAQSKRKKGEAVAKLPPPQEDTPLVR